MKRIAQIITIRPNPRSFLVRLIIVENKLVKQSHDAFWMGIGTFTASVKIPFRRVRDVGTESKSVLIKSSPT